VELYPFSETAMSKEPKEDNQPVDPSYLSQILKVNTPAPKPAFPPSTSTPSLENNPYANPLRPSED
jgi:hypothetical protein